MIETGAHKGLERWKASCIGDALCHFATLECIPAFPRSNAFLDGSVHQTLMHRAATLPVRYTKESDAITQEPPQRRDPSSGVQVCVYHVICEIRAQEPAFSEHGLAANTGLDCAHNPQMQGKRGQSLREAHRGPRGHTGRRRAESTAASRGCAAAWVSTRTPVCE